ncbi:MAG TPA: FG-GAP-like repeat-containing protein [Blastocatellia bacterium]|nr:FG-GAP-like repeat-containing protein [Blastocatellia bacterium]
MQQVIAFALAGWILLIGLLWPQQVQQQVTPDERLRRAGALFDQRRFAEAADEARRARELDPKLLQAWKLSGLSLQLAGRAADAEREFALAIQLFPNDSDLWFYLSRVQYLQSSLKPAEASARRALQSQPDHAGAHTQLAMTLEALNDYPNALEHYRRGVELSQKLGRPPTLPLVYTANLLVKLNRVEEALDYLTRASAIDPRSSEIRLSRGRALEKLGRIAEAEKEYQQAATTDGSGQARAALDRLRAGATPGPVTAKPAASIELIRFRNVAEHARLDFVLRNNASPRKYQVETMTGGVAVIDYDKDGWMDIYFVNGAELPAMKKSSPEFWNRLYRNNRDGTFSDVTEKAGVKAEAYSMGAAVADYDNDGDQDLFVAGVHRNILFRNDGQGRFDDVSTKAGLSGGDPRQGKMWSVAAAWLDYDNDGDLDLFVVNYCKWSPEIDPYCGAMKEGWRTYCYPDRYEGLPNQLFRNNGDGTFADVSNQSGVAKHIGKGMGVAIADYDDDGFVDLFVANDTLPNFLFRNNGRGGFEEAGLTAGVAVNDSGRPVSAMGVDFRDYDNDGLPDLIVSALEGETYPLFRNLGKGFFTDATWQSGLGAETVKRSGWSLGLFDFNNDGFKDLFTVNAHVNDNIELYNNQTYRQPNSVFAGAGAGAFLEASHEAGADFQVKRAHRGCAFADFDNDGRVDVVTTSLNEPVELFRNESTGESHWLAIRLVGAKSNRDGIGARIKLMTTDGNAQFNHVTTSVGYASSSDIRAHFGLGKEKTVKLIEVRWPSGATQRLKEVAADRLLTVTEEPK